MDHLSKLRRRARLYLFGILIAENLLAVGLGWSLYTFVHLNGLISVAVSLLLGMVLTFIVADQASRYLMEPLTALWQAILHLSPTEQGVAAPKIENLRFGRELVANLSSQIYQLASVADRAAADANKEVGDMGHNFIAQNLPLPLVLLDDTETIKFANKAAADYIGLTPADLIGKNVYMVLDMSFPSADTFDSWLKTAKTASVTATKSWERVRLNVRD